MASVNDNDPLLKDYAEAQMIVRVAVSEGQAPGQVFVPMHWTDAMASAGRTGALMPLAAGRA